MKPSGDNEPPQLSSSELEYLADSRPHPAVELAQPIELLFLSKHIDAPYWLRVCPSLTRIAESLENLLKMVE